MQFFAPIFSHPPRNYASMASSSSSSSSLAPLSLSPLHLPTSSKPRPFPPQTLILPSVRPALRSRVKALREWREYEDAVRDKDLARALRFLKTLEVPMASPADSVSYSPGWARPERDWEVLDTCLNADDMRLVGSAYQFLQDRGLLPNFGKCKSIGMDSSAHCSSILQECGDY